MMTVSSNPAIRIFIMSGLLIFCISCMKISLPQVRTLSFEILTLDTVIISGEVTDEGGSAVTKRGFCWGEHPDPTLIDQSSENQTGSGVFTERLRNPPYGTECFFRCYASNADGFVYGNVLAFKIELSPEKETITDSRDGKEYLTVKIGQQEWMAENLAYLPVVSPSWDESDHSPYYYVYSYEGSQVEEAKSAANFSKHGVLYNWPAALAACPSGWHLPSDAEWKILTDFLGSYPGGKMKESGTANWKYASPSANNMSGFTALGSGVRYYHFDYFYLGEYAYFWSSTASEPAKAWYRRLNDINDNVFRTDGYKRLGMSVRCVR